MRKILMFVMLFVFLVSPSAFAQKRKAVRHRSSGSVAYARAPVMTICVNDPLPSGYWIVKQTFDSSCPEVNNFNRAYLISVDGAASGDVEAYASGGGNSGSLLQKTYFALDAFYKKLDGVKVGDSQAAVLNLVGEPSTIDSSKDSDGKSSSLTYQISGVTAAVFYISNGVVTSIDVRDKGRVRGAIRDFITDMFLRSSH